jgi:hypothetical protein
LVAFLLLLIGAASDQAHSGAEAINDRSVTPPSSFEIPFKGPGQLATIWSWGPNRPDSGKALVLTRREGTKRITAEAPKRVRWRSGGDFILEQAAQPIRDGSGTRIVRMMRDGAVIEVLSDQEGLSGSQPSPDGRWVFVERFGKRGALGSEIRDLASGFRLHTFYQNSLRPDGFAWHAVWSPEAERLVATIPISEDTGLVPHLILLSRDQSTFARLPDQRADGEVDPGGVVPLFWSKDGIYARSNSGLLRCDPAGSGCTLVYSPGKARFAFAGVRAGEKRALLLVQDLKLDPFEVRAKEIHEVDLATGEGQVLLRLPVGVFLSDIDWIQDEDNS